MAKKFVVVDRKLRQLALYDRRHDADNHVASERAAGREAMVIGNRCCG